MINKILKQKKIIMILFLCGFTLYAVVNFDDERFTRIFSLFSDVIQTVEEPKQELLIVPAGSTPATI